MAQTASDKGRYTKVEMQPLSQDSTSKPASKSMVKRRKAKSWRAPAIILLGLLFGIGFALAHHFMNVHLNGKPVDSIDLINQAWASRIGTGLAFAVKLSLATSVGAAYMQRQWLRMHQVDFTAAEVDSLTSILGNALGFFDGNVWVHHPLLAAVALVSWAIPLAAIATPGTLTVAPAPDKVSMDLHVPQLEFSNATNFGSRTLFRPMWVSTGGTIPKLVYQTASSGEPVRLLSTYQNQSYHLDFDGPALRCSSANDSVVQNATFEWAGLSAQAGNQWKYVAWVPGDVHNSSGQYQQFETLDYASQDASRLFVMSNIGIWNSTIPQTDPYSGVDLEVLKVNVTECLLYNATYSVDFTFQYPNQTRAVAITKWLNPVVGYFDYSGSTDDQSGLLYDPLVAYLAVMDAFGKLMVGSTSHSHYGLETSIATSWQITNLDYSDGEAVQRGLEQLMQNITLSLLSDSGLIHNDTTADPVAVKVVAWPVTYNYKDLDLFFAYGLSILFALLCSAVGLHAFFINNGSYQNMFTTYLRAASGSEFRSLILPEDTGADPLPKDLAKTKLAMGSQGDT